MDTFYFFKSKRKFKFNIASFFCIVCQLHVVMVTVFVCTQSQRKMPLQTGFFPEFIPETFCARANKELHFHLFKFTHTEDKLTGNYLISKGFTSLGNPKRNLHPCSLLHIQEVYKDALSCFWT